MKDLNHKTPTPAVVEPAELIAFIKSDLKRCQSNNPLYSLRAHAKKLNIDPSLLSKIFNGKRPLTAKLVDRIQAPLGLSGLQAATIKNAIHKQKASLKAQAHLALMHFNKLDERFFKILSKWYYYAILELKNISNTPLTAEYVADKLGITKACAERAIKQIDIIAEVNQINSMRSHYTTTHYKQTNEDLKNLQKEYLALASQAIDKYPLTQRDHSTVIVAVDSKLIPEAKERIKRFRRELVAFLESSNEKDRILNISTALYPVSKPLDKPESTSTREEEKSCAV